MEKRPLGGRHWLEPETFLFGRASKDSELALLHLCPRRHLSEELKGGVRVRDMVVLVSLGVNVERLGQLLLTLKPKALIVTLQRFVARLPWVVFRRQASNFLFPVLARTSDESLGFAWLVFLARWRLLVGIL